MNPLQKTGFWLGVAGMLLAIAVVKSGMALPDGLSAQGVYLAGVVALMACWWVSEAIHLAATSLIPLVAFPVFGIMGSPKTATAYADRFILLLMGGFFVAMCLEKWQLHKRIALAIMDTIGAEPRRLVMSFMLTSAVLSMWISNTATTLMMLPIAIAVLQRMEAESDAPVEGISLALMLGIAYAASIGGMGTPIGTPPNIIFIKLYEEQFPNADPIGFLQWMLLAIPVVIVLLAFVWWYLVNIRGKIPKGLTNAGEKVIAEERKSLGLITRPERRVAWIFAITALLWIFRKSITLGDDGLTIPGWAPMLGLDGKVDDSTVAIGAALACFILPAGSSKKGEKLLDWDTAVKIPWGLLLLFGGGIALAKGFMSTGLSAYVGGHLSSLEALPSLLVIGITCLLVTFLTEVTSNTATTNILIPILGAAAVAMGDDPLLLMIPATLSASCAFMLPVATAPNAIVFGSGKITISQMARAGFMINIVGGLLISLLLYFYGLPLLGAL